MLTGKRENANATNNKHAVKGRAQNCLLSRAQPLKACFFFNKHSWSGQQRCHNCPREKLLKFGWCPGVTIHSS